MNFKAILIFSGLVSFSAISTAGGLAELDVFLKSTDAGVLNYTQTTIRKKFDGTPRTSESKARLEFSRPFNFRVEYEPPNEYVVVGDGKTVTMHDPILMATSTHAHSAMFAASFSLLLEARAISALADGYDFREDSANGFEWAVVTPKIGKESIFEKMSFGFQRNVLTRLELINPGGDRLVYRINWESLEPPNPSRFTYSVPAGSDFEDKTDQAKPTSTPGVVQ